MTRVAVADRHLAARPGPDAVAIQTLGQSLCRWAMAGQTSLAGRPSAWGCPGDSTPGAKAKPLPSLRIGCAPHLGSPIAARATPTAPQSTIDSARPCGDPISPHRERQPDHQPCIQNKVGRPSIAQSLPPELAQARQTVQGRDGRQRPRHRCIPNLNPENRLDQQHRSNERSPGLGTGQHSLADGRPQLLSRPGLETGTADAASEP